MSSLEEIIKILPSIGSEALAVFLCMIHESSKDGTCAISIPELQTMTGSSRPTVVKAIDKLEAAQLISKQRRFRQSTVYTLSKYKSIDFLLLQCTTTIKEDVVIHDKSKESLLLQDDTENGDLAQYASEYASLTGLYVGSPRDIQAFVDMKEMGAQPGDIKMAIEILRGKKFTFNGPAGLVNTIRGIVTDRNLEKNGINSGGKKEVFLENIGW